MTKHFSSVILRVLFTVTLVAVIAFWVSRAAVSSAQADLGRARSSAVVPFLISGLVLDLHRWLSEPLVAVHALRPPRLRTIFVSSDDCAFCIRQAPAWCSFLKSQTWPEDIEWQVVSLNGMDIPGTLAGCAESTVAPGRFRAAHVRNRTVFTSGTGITATPMVLVLDERYRLLGALPAGDMTALQSFVTRPST
jgi:hypothetical protein